MCCRKRFHSRFWDGNGLVHVPGLGLPGPIKIFPFKSLRQLELRGVPLHCLRGLRGIYSQLETLICSRSLQALEELLSACGGDLCSALPWLALLSADFSYNALTALDSSLRLLSALRFLNLSHNQVQDCKGFLMDLSELCHLDISYNHLRLVPRMGPSGAALGTLILRGNELQSLHGLEQLRNLRHLDVAYNLLQRHRELSPLWLLAELRKLYLEGNPLWFHPEHRVATARYLSPRARDAAAGFLLDGKALSLTDFQTSTSSGLGPMAPPLPWPVGSTTETSGGPDLSDSPSSGGVVAQPPLRKVKSRVRVRRASISEPSDTDPEPRTLDPSSAGWFVQQRRELELMASFRERFGCDWLQYRNHLETPALSTLSPDALSPETAPSPLPPEKASPQEVAEEVRVELQEEEEREEQGEEEGGEEEEKEPSEAEVKLCRPMLVCPLEGPEGVRGRDCFLWVTAGHLFEVELQAARTLERLELQSLEAAEIEAETQTHSEPVPEGSDPRPGGPILVLRFSYICPDRQLRRYVVLEPDAQAAVQELLAVLTPAATTQHQLGEVRDPPENRRQCLRCGREFKPEEPRLGLDSEEGWRPLFQKTESAVCPNCGSDHVVLLAVSSGTPSGERRQGEQWPALSQSLSTVRDPPGHSDYSPRAGSAPSQAPASHDRWSLSPPPERCGLRAVDHRLRLFLDVEVFTDAQEEFQCCLKVPLALADHPGEFLCLVVVSDHRLYVLKVTGQICGPPAGWLQLTLAIPLQDLSSIELGLAGQSLRLEWAAGAGGCVLLPRDAKHCRAFLEELTDVLQSLPPTRRSGISATEEEVTPKHWLWPLLETDSSSEPPQFFYLRAFLVEGPATCPVSLLLTLSTLYLLDEDPIRSQAEPPLPAASGEASEKPPPPGPGPSVRVREQQPLSSLSSVLLYRVAPEDLRLVFYDEVSRLESFWALRVVCPEQLTALLAWIREPWEELFSIGLRTVTREAVDLDQ
ncbi:serine/threonine-protein kinase 11-interacting protein isoform X2 [Hippopotamus amphibius kiboko]|uniref:serine/threonine-protein kinase 11-interacting protein isoform X2 n=1 Tax=Hippopotamus amphibius kiboko TaxID=575201 RepID=UPI0025942522|nr:serine/threonine-protein kinase 11-interacting protein isoform X2 [Hippopotamus amphibius kiboko]XP_057602584.1 serine/threonine-protein kinase 11-interacting protein isoform X2 [Hippopotamus amphibius kiboko]XP_057602585.1 serine/threonine-protein kinase 11-interacting protein isoform X2 [Hippopotamus amphibius kiboko]